jgi:hypothetical protein
MEARGQTRVMEARVGGPGSDKVFGGPGSDKVFGSSKPLTRQDGPDLHSSREFPAPAGTPTVPTDGWTTSSACPTITDGILAHHPALITYRATSADSPSRLESSSQIRQGTVALLEVRAHARGLAFLGAGLLEPGI